jgi:carboxymethylenebutenolidase
MITAIEIKTPDGVCDAWIAKPEGKGPRPAVIFCMDAVGPRPTLRAMAERLAAEGYVVLLPNLFYREKRAPIVSGIPSPITLKHIPDILNQIMPLVQRFDPTAALRDMKIFLEYLDIQPNVQKGKAGIFGYCMGGAMAIRSAAAYPQRFAAVASFHAGGLVTGDAESPHRLLPKLKAALYVAHADSDPHMTADQIAEFGRAVDQLSIPHQVELYAGAQHHFTMVDLPAYDAAAAERHWQELTGLFGRTLAS